MAYLKLDLKNKTIINIDETWLGMSDFTRMKWKPYGAPNTTCKKMIVPRISMILALDSNGGIYLSLLQSNSNSEMFELFFTHFIHMMERKRPGWRKDHIILLDGAGYHNSSTMMQFYEKH